MTIKAIISGEELELQLVSYSDEGFKLSDSKGLYEDILLSTPLTLNCEFSNKEFEVFFLAKKDILENHIYQIYDDSRKARIGWCIPVNALDSGVSVFLCSGWLGPAVRQALVLPARS
ncbi:hypothetical protein, partial [Pseudomonas savastanoi]|uniref:hypothetical protein n=1 Tax=Pseudomonas savastanoi TaxID=29438 RepID=UPI001EE6F7AC